MQKVPNKALQAGKKTGRRCLTCEGKGSVKTYSGRIICVKCLGTGRQDGQYLTKSQPPKRPAKKRRKP